MENTVLSLACLCFDGIPPHGQELRLIVYKSNITITPDNIAGLVSGCIFFSTDATE